MTIEWVNEDEVAVGVAKYPQLLATIKAEQLASTVHRGKWAKLATYEVEGSARDATNRLKKAHEDFDFISRKNDDNTTSVYARLKEGVDE